MALPDLATTEDLDSRGVAVCDIHEVMLAVASSIVREAAGTPIAEIDSTVSLTAWGEQSLPLPGKPITAVDTVAIASQPVTDWILTDDGSLWRRCGWGCIDEPTNVAVTYTHGLPTVPEHIVQLVCDLAILGADTATDGALDPRVEIEQIDDYKVTFTKAGSAMSTAMSLPPATRLALAAEFGGGAAMVATRR